MNPRRGVRRTGVPLHRVTGVGDNILIGLFQNVLNQPLPELGQGVAGFVQGGILFFDFLHHGGDLSVQFVPGAVIIRFPVTEIIIKTAALNGANQHSKRLPVQCDGADRRLLCRQILLVGSLKKVLAELMNRHQCVEIGLIKLRICFEHGNRNSVDCDVAFIPAVLLITVHPGVCVAFIVQKLRCDGVRFPHQNVIGGDGSPFRAEENLNVLSIFHSNSPLPNEFLRCDILHPLCGKVVQVVPQLGNPFTRLRVDLLIDWNAAILLEGQRLHRPLFPVNPEGHFRVIHGIAVLSEGMAEGDNIIGDPLDMEGHIGRPSLQAHTAVFAADDLREQFSKSAVIDLRACASGLFGPGHSRRRFGNIIPDFGNQPFEGIFFSLRNAECHIAIFLDSPFGRDSRLRHWPC